MKQEWKVKDKGKQAVGEDLPEIEAWIKPKKVATPTIQVGNMQIPIGNGYQDLVTGGIGDEGGDLIPFSLSHEDDNLECKGLQQAI